MLAPSFSLFLSFSLSLTLLSCVSL
jgi:hypothetical protein